MRPLGTPRPAHPPAPPRLDMRTVRRHRGAQAPGRCVMTCDAPVRQCLEWHYAEHLAQVKITNGGRSLRARCPVCDGDRRSLGISAGEHLRIVWQCFAGCDGNEVRRALRVAGIPPGCLPRGDGTEHSRTDIVAAILASGTRHDRAHTILRAYTVLRGHTRWPRGRELIATVQRPAHGCLLSRCPARPWWRGRSAVGCTFGSAVGCTCAVGCTSPRARLAIVTCGPLTSLPLGAVELGVSG